MKVIKPRQAKGLHEIKRKKPIRAVKDKKRGVRLTRVSYRTRKALIAVSMVGVLTFGIFGFGMLGNPEYNDVEEGFVSVAMALPKDGSTPEDHTGIENIAYMNTRLQGQEVWYSESHSTVDTIVAQTVDTYKQFSNGVMIQSDITKSSLINEAQQFCWTATDVLWRTMNDNVSAWNGIDSPWKDVKPNHRTIYDFTYVDKCGLPGTAFSVYVLREETVLEAEPVVNHGDGTYSQTFLLDPASDKAPAHYGNQMVFKGGLSAPPPFEYITVTYTFDSTWQILSSETEEKYTATKKGIPVPATCVSKTRTEYEYGTERAYHTAYDDYFVKYIDSSTTEVPSSGELTAVDCLGAAFGSMLSEPTSLALTVDLNGYALNGIIYLDVAAMDIRADLGNGAVKLWYDSDGIYLAYGGIKVKASPDGLSALLTGVLPSEPSDSAGESELNLDAILADLGSGEFTLKENTATLSATLNLMGLSIPVEFGFLIGEDSSVALDKVQANIAVSEDFALGATMAFTDTKLPALGSADKSNFVELVPYLEGVLELAKSEAINLAVSYNGGDMIVNGSLDFSLNGGIRLAGDIDISYKGALKTLLFAYLDGTVYLDLDGVKVSATVEQAIEFIGTFINLNATDGSTDFNIGRIVEMLFSEQFFTALELAESNGSMNLSVKVLQIFELFGIGFAPDGLDEIRLSVTKTGVVTVQAMGAEIVAKAGEEFTFVTDGYADILPYVQNAMNILSDGVIDIALSDMQVGDLTVSADLSLRLAELAASGEVRIAYGDSQKILSFVYTDDTVYLTVDGIRFKATVSELISLIGQVMNGDEAASAALLSDGGVSAETITVTDLLNALFGVKLGDLLQISEKASVLSVTTDADGILGLFGLDLGISLGQIKVEIPATGSIGISALGVRFSVCAGDANSFDGTLSAIDGNDFIELRPYVETLVNLFTGKALEIGIDYTNGDYAVTGIVTVNLDFENVLLVGELTVSYLNDEQTLTFALAEDTFYAELCGLKVKGSVSDLLALVNRFESGSDSANGLDLTSVIEYVFSRDLQSLLNLKEQSGALSVTLNGTELLAQLLNFDFSLGDIELAVAQNAIMVNVLGATVTVVSADEAAFLKEDYSDYVDVLPYIERLLDLFMQNEVLDIALDYAYGTNLSVSGVVSLNWKTLTLSGNLTLVYDGAVIPAYFAYSDGTAYFDIYGFKGKTTLAAVLSVLPFDSSASAKGIFTAEQVAQLVQGILSLEPNSLLSLTEADGELRLTLNGTKLLSLFGVDFGLGDVNLTVGAESLVINGFGANVRISAGSSVTLPSDPNEYADVTSVLELIPEVLEKGMLDLSGEVTLTVSDSIVTLAVREGVIKWKNGFDLYLDLELGVNGVNQRIILEADTASVKMAYGSVGVDLVFEEFDTLEIALVDLYQTIKSVLDETLVNGSAIPEVENFADLCTLLEGLLNLKTAVAAEGGEGASLPALAEILGKLVISAPVSPNGICAITLEGISLEILNGENGISVTFGYAGNGLSVTGGLSVAVSQREGLPEMPQDVQYLTAADFATMLGYAGTAAQMLAKTDITVTIEGATQTVAQGSAVVTEVTGTLSYHTGGNTLFTIDTDEKTFTVTPELYLNLSLQIVSKNGGTSTYLDFLVFDLDGDAELDFFVTLSKFARDAQEYAPLRIYAPASELMTIFSSGLAILGVDVGFVNDYVVSKWLNVTTTEQLTALGSLLKLSLGFGSLDFNLGGAAPASHGERALTEAFLRSITVGENSFSVVLDSNAVYGATGLNDLTFTVNRAFEEDGEGNKIASYLTGISLSHIYNGDATEVTSVRLGFGYAPIVPSAENINLNDYLDVSGIGRLLVALGNTATHQVENDSNEAGQTSYAVNEKFYIEGVLTAKVLTFAPTFNIAISIGLNSEGAMEFNLRLQYEGLGALGQIAINGDTVFEMTVKEGMVYMCQTQTSNHNGWSNKPCAPVTTYRVMPLDVFFSNILDQLEFILNFGSVISNQIDTSGSGDSGAAETVVDYGDALGAGLSGYSYSMNETSCEEVWSVLLNGDELTGGVMNEIGIDIKTDSEGCIRYLNVNQVKLYSVVTLSAALELKNPQGIACDDVTQDVANTVSGALDKALDAAEAAEWKDSEGNYVYVEGVLTTITFEFPDGATKSQNVMYDGSTHKPYADIVAPDLSEYREIYKGYTVEWLMPSAFTANMVVYTSITANRYLVTFESDRALDGFSFDAALGLYVASTVYVYGDGFYFADGNGEIMTDGAGNRLRFEFPAVDEQGYCVSAFAGESITLEGFGKNDLAEILSDTSFTAVWEKIAYSVTFVMGETQETQTAYYGDEYGYSIGIELDGYTFSRWTDENGNEYETLEGLTVTGSKTFTAVYASNRYTVTLVSEYAATGFDGEEFTAQDGAYFYTFTYVYGTNVTLPICDNSELGLHLCGYIDENGTLVYRITAQLGDATYSAVWEEIGYSLTFVDESGATVTVLNAHLGDEISTRSDLPAVPVKVGYTGKWLFGDDVVSGDTVVRASYTANEYTVTIVSEFALEGYTAGEDGYYRYLTYTYDMNQIVLPADGMKVPHFDFMGYYTQPNGAGVRVEKIDNGIIDTLTLYVYQQDNGVTVTLWSDRAFENSSALKQVKETSYLKLEGYTCELTLYDEYTLPDLTAEGFRMLGWWNYGSDGWDIISDVKGMDGADVIAMWIQDVSVVITTIDSSFYLVTTTYHIAGTVVGGDVYGSMGTSIAAATNMLNDGNPNVVGSYRIYNSSGSYDSIGGTANKVTISKAEDGSRTFDSATDRPLGLESTHGTSWTKYAGITLTFTYSYTNHSGRTYQVTTTGGSFVSYNEYVMTFDFGDEKQEVALRVPCPFSEFDQPLFVRDIAPEIPESYLIEGYYPPVWDSADRQITIDWSGSDWAALLVYLPMPYSVTVGSTVQIEGMEYSSVTDGSYLYEFEMNYLGTVEFYAWSIAAGGFVLQETYMVSTMGNFFELYDGAEVRITAELGNEVSRLYIHEVPDHIKYYSAIEFDSMLSEAVSFTVDYTLIDAAADGYTFLGWYLYSEESGWQKITSLAPTGEGKEYVVEALWMSNLEVNITKITSTSSGVITKKYTYTITSTVSGCILYGAFADEAEVSLNLRYYVNNNTDDEPTTNHGSSTVALTGSSVEHTQTCEAVSGSKDYAHLAVTAKIQYQGETLLTTNAVYTYTKI